MIVVVSPHLDDAVLSCGGMLADAARRGERALVVTVFTEGSGHRRRRDEDREALAILGAEALHLGLSDAPERLGIARSHAALVEGPVALPEDVAAVRAALAGALESARGAIVYAPLGVGGHVDHRVVHAALRDRPAIALYEDRPYALVPGAVPARLVEARITLAPEVGDLAPPADVAPSPSRALPEYLARSAARDDLIAALPHLRAFLPSDPTGRARSLDWIEAAIARPRPDPSLAEMVVAPRVLAIDDASAALAARAALAYASQPPLLPPNLAPLERTYHRFSSSVR